MLMCTAAEVSGAARIYPTIPNGVPARTVTTSTTTGVEPQRRAHDERLDEPLERTVRKQHDDSQDQRVDRALEP